MFGINHKIVASSFSLLCAFSSVATFAKDGEKHISIQQDVANAELIKLSVPAGDVDIIGTTGNTLTAEATATCQDEHRQACNKLLKQLDWNKQIGSTTEFALAPAGISNYNRISIKIKLSVPEDKKLEVSLSAGELNISGTSACLVADLNAGEINITLKENQLASASLSAKVGDVKLTTPKGETIDGKRSLLIGAKLDWIKGTGNCHTKASVLTGEANLILN